jgi:hypothetical protein
LQFEKELLPEDGTNKFYEELAKYTNVQRQYLLNDTGEDFEVIFDEIINDFSDAYSVSNNLLTALINNDIAVFDKAANWSVLNQDINSYPIESLTGELLTIAVHPTMLSDNYRDTLQTIKSAIDIQKFIPEVKDCKLFDILQKDLTVAWQDENTNWMDSAGNYYQKLTDYKDAAKAPEWVSYPVKGTSKEQADWANAEGDWVGIDGKWRNNAGTPIKVEVRRCNDGTWEEFSSGGYSAIDWIDTTWQKANENTDLQEILTAENVGLLAKVADLGQFTNISEAAREANSILILEEQLLKEIREIDKNRDFYYNVPIESNFAIDFNESNATLNTLKNPAVNYDINNVNNNFVISKIDINYLTKGLQIALSSRLN